MYLKLTIKEKENKLLRLKNRLQDIEREQESGKMIRAWREFLSLSPQEKYSRYEQWGKYYKNCQSSVSAEMFRQQKDAAHKEDWGKVRELGREAKKMREENAHITIDVPNFEDPWEFDKGWVKEYQDCTYAIRELNKDLNEPISEEDKEIWSN